MYSVSKNILFNEISNAILISSFSGVASRELLLSPMPDLNKLAEMSEVSPLICYYFIFIPSLKEIVSAMPAGEFRAVREGGVHLLLALGRLPSEGEVSAHCSQGHCWSSLTFTMLE